MIVQIMKIATLKKLEEGNEQCPVDAVLMGAFSALWFFKNLKVIKLTHPLRMLLKFY